MDIELIDKIEKLRDKIRSLGKVAVAFSGGVDSTFLLAMAREAVGEAAIAVTVRASTFSQEEIVEAAKYCRENNIKQITVDMDMYDIKGFAENPPDRCYICKKAIFSGIIEAAQNEGIFYVADGTNSDDMLDYRPGILALQELNVVSPLKEIGFTKEEIRLVLKKKGINLWEKPAYACLATRIPYGNEITKGKLQSIEKLENYLHHLGFLQVRVRHHGDVARIEVLPWERERFFQTELMDRVDNKAKECGFQFVALDLAGYKMGNMNLNNKKQIGDR